MASTSTNRTTKSSSSGRGRGGRRPINISNLPPEEAQKREKRRERNKLAAARCRQRKLDHANTLVEQAYCLEAEHERLATQLQSMLQHVHSLKRTIDQHEGPLESACRNKRLKFDGQFDLMMLNYEAMNEAMRPLLPDEEEEINTTTEAEDSAVEIKIEDDDEENDSQISSSNEAWEATTNVNIFSSKSFQQQQQNAAASSSFKQSEPVGLCVLSTESKESQPNQKSFPWNSWANKLNPITFPLPTNSLDVSLLQTHENKQQEDLMMTSNNNRSSCSSQESVVYQREQESSFTLSLRDSFNGASSESSMTKPNRPNSLQVLGFGNLNAMSSSYQSEPTTFVPETSESTALATPTLSTDALQTPTSGFLLDNWNSISGLLALSSPIVPTSNNLAPSSSASGADALTPNTLDAFVRSFASP